MIGEKCMPKHAAGIDWLLDGIQVEDLRQKVLPRGIANKQFAIKLSKWELYVNSRASPLKMTRLPHLCLRSLHVAI